MNARQQLKPKTIRLAILLALADGAITTIDDLQIRMDEPRKKVVDNAVHAANDDLIKRLRDDVTGGPAYQITPKGREHLASFAGEKEEVAEKSPAAESDAVDEQASRRISRAANQTIVTPCVKVDIPDRHEPTASAIIGAMAFGHQGGNVPPEGHWLTEFYQLGAADARKDAEIARLTSQRDAAWHELSEIRLVIKANPEESTLDEVKRFVFETASDLASFKLSQLAHATPAPVGYVTQRTGKPLARFTKAESAQARAMSSARAGKRAKVFALVPVGAVVPGSEWVMA